MYVDVLDNVTNLDKKNWEFPTKERKKYYMKFKEYHINIPSDDISNCNE